VLSTIYLVSCCVKLLINISGVIIDANIGILRVLRTGLRVMRNGREHTSFKQQIQSLSLLNRRLVIFHAGNKYLKYFHTFQITTAVEYLVDTDLVTALLLLPLLRNCSVVRQGGSQWSDVHTSYTSIEALFWLVTSIAEMPCLETTRNIDVWPWSALLRHSGRNGTVIVLTFSLFCLFCIVNVEQRHSLGVKYFNCFMEFFHR
jgi:hypothetical protein